MPITAPETIRVVAAALIDAHGRVLLAQRPQRAHQGGLWEFPGGKIEASESATAALRRELQEEIGVTPVHARPLKAVTHDYGDRRVHLAVWRVDAWEGEAIGREGQAIQWVSLAELADRAMPAADRPICQALRLPEQIAIVADPSPVQLQGLPANVALLLRAPELSASAYAERLQRLRRDWPQRLWYAHDRVDLVQPLQLAGVHASRRVWQHWQERPGLSAWCGASAHDGEDLQHLQALGLDYVTLSPVQPTNSHIGQPALGWDRFAALCSGTTLCVYALGGVGPADLARAWQQGGQGVAGISAYQ